MPIQIARMIAGDAMTQRQVLRAGARIGSACTNPSRSSAGPNWVGRKRLRATANRRRAAAVSHSHGTLSGLPDVISTFAANQFGVSHSSRLRVPCTDLGRSKDPRPRNLEIHACEPALMKP